MTKEILMTAQGYEGLLNELAELKTVRRNEISEKIRIARGFGDLSENSEYDEAKNEQAIVEARILQLEEQLKKARVIDEKEMVSDVISVGMRVKILDTEMDEVLEYRIVSSVEANHSMETITDESPVGKALLGHKAGERISVTVPSGDEIEFEILEIGV